MSIFYDVITEKLLTVKVIVENEINRDHDNVTQAVPISAKLC